MDFDRRTDLLREMQARLARHYPDYPPRYLLLDPVSQLVMSLLGGRTKSPVSKAAHAGLLRCFRNWSEVRDADVRRLERLIQNVTFADIKARRIKTILSFLSRRTGRPSLAVLDGLSVQQAHAWLERIDGIGPKIAAAVLNTSTLRRRSLVIDTHHLRILIRVGMLPPGSDFRKAYRLVMPLVPDDWTAETIDVHHMLFKRLGQDICRPFEPKCGRCPFSSLCRHARRSRTSGARPNTLSGPPSLPGPSRRARSGSEWP